MSVDFFSTVGGQNFVHKTETNLRKIAQSLDEISEQMKEANRLKAIELQMMNEQIGASIDKPHVRPNKSDQAP